MSATTTVSVVELEYNVNFDQKAGLKDSIIQGVEYLESIATPTLEAMDARLKIRAEPAVVNNRGGVELHLSLLQPRQDASVTTTLPDRVFSDPVARDILLLQLWSRALREWSALHMRRFDAEMAEILAREEVGTNA